MGYRHEWWRAVVLFPEWLRRAATPAVSVSALLAGLWFLHEQFIWPYFENFRMLAFMHCQSDYLGWVGSMFVAATCASPHAIDTTSLIRLNYFAMPVVAYACVTATWVAGVRSVGWIAGGTAALLTAMSPMLFVVAHAAAPSSILPLVAVCTLVCAECAAHNSDQPTLRGYWQIATLLFALLIASLDVRAGVIGAAALLHAMWRGSPANARAWVATASACFALALMFFPAGDWPTAVVRAGVRALPLDVIGYGFPETWRVLPYFGDWFGFVVVSLLIGAAWVARTTVLPLAVAGMFAQCALLAVASWSTTSVVSMTYAIAIVALCIGAVTQWLAARHPRVLALLPPALLATAFVVTYGTLAILQSFDPEERNPGGPFAFSPGSAARLYHIRGNAAVAELYADKDAMWADEHGADRGRILEPTNAAVIVESAVAMSEGRSLVYGYSVRSRDGRWSGYAPARELWLEPAVGQCVRPISGTRIRLYDQSVIPYRSTVIGQMLSGEMRVLDVRDAPWLPELHVLVTSSSARPQSGWVYIQTIDLWSPESPSRSDGFACGSGAARPSSP